MVRYNIVSDWHNTKDAICKSESLRAARTEAHNAAMQSTTVEANFCHISLNKRLRPYASKNVLPSF
jgi:hypothetical protein